MVAGTAVVLALLSLLIWVVLIGFRGGFWRADQRLDRSHMALDNWPPVFAVIPARNEAETVGRTVATLLAQDYAGQLDVVLVDDESTDGTADAARAAAGASTRLHVVTGMPLAAGWTGKLWAMSQGHEHGQRVSPDAAFVLFTDADIEFPRDGLRRLVAKAETAHLDLVSVMVKLRCRGLWERLLVPAFVFFFQKLYPFPWINDPDRGSAGAAGGCMLVRRRALAEAGGISAIRGQIIDDCALAACIKDVGPIWLGLAEDFRSVRPYERLEDFWRMVSRTAFVQLNYSYAAVIGTFFAMIVIYVVPPVAMIAALVARDPMVGIPAAAAWLVMATAYWPTLKFYGGRIWQLALLPIAAALYAVMTVDSAIQYGRGQGSAWKGRHYERSASESG